MMPERDKESRRSMLQVFILIHLRKGPVKTITDLADAVKSQRPSVSRSMRLLREDGLVEQSDQGWCLTDAGLHEAQEAETKLAAAAQKVAKTLNSSMQGLMAVAGFTDSLRQQQADFHHSLRQRIAVFDRLHRHTLAGLTDSLRQQQADLHHSLRQRLASFDSPRLNVADAIKPLAEAQRLNLRLMTKATEPLHTYSALAAARHINLSLTEAMDNALALNQSALASLAKDIPNADRLAWAWPRLSEVTRSFGRLFAEQSSTWLTQPSLDLELAQSEAMVLPTTTVARYTESLRRWDEAETDTPPHPVHIPTDDLGDEGLDPLLAKINPEFVDMRQASWQVMMAGGKDRLRHAAVSQREMVSQLLCRLVPDTALPEEARGSPSIKARARIILDGSRSGADFVDAVAKALFEFYNQLSKYTHQNEKHEASLRAILQTGEGLIRLILVQAR